MAQDITLETNIIPIGFNRTFCGRCCLEGTIKYVELSHNCAWCPKRFWGFKLKNILDWLDVYDNVYEFAVVEFVPETKVDWGVSGFASDTRFMTDNITIIKFISFDTMVRKAIMLGVDFNLWGGPILCLAVKNGYTRSVYAILDCGVEPDIFDNEPYKIAMQSKNYDIATILTFRMHCARIEEAKKKKKIIDDMESKIKKEKNNLYKLEKKIITNRIDKIAAPRTVKKNSSKGSTNTPRVNTATSDNQSN